MWTRIGLLTCALVFFGCGATQLPNGNGGGNTGGNGGGTGNGGGVANGGGGGSSGGGTSNGGGGGSSNGGGSAGAGGGVANGGGGGSSNGGGGGATGPVGASCTSVCDCDSGLVCLMGSCTANPTQFSLYCCTAKDCPDGSYCQTTDGNIQMCGDTGGGGGIGFPGGTPDMAHHGGGGGGNGNPDMAHHGGTP